MTRAAKEWSHQELGARARGGNLMKKKVDQNGKKETVCSEVWRLVATTEDRTARTQVHVEAGGARLEQHEAFGQASEGQEGSD